MRGNGSLRAVTPPMLTSEGHVLPRKIEGVEMLVHYDRGYAVHKVATSLVEPLLIGGYTSQELRDTLVELVEEAIVVKRPTIRFKDGKSMTVEEYYRGQQPVATHSVVADLDLPHPAETENFPASAIVDRQTAHVYAESLAVDDTELMAITDDPRREIPEIDLSEDLSIAPSNVSSTDGDAAKPTASRKVKK